MWVAIGLLSCVVLAGLISFSIWKLNQLESGPKPTPLQFDEARPAWLSDIDNHDKSPSQTQLVNQSVKSLSIPRPLSNRSLSVGGEPAPALARGDQRQANQRGAKTQPNGMVRQRELSAETARRLAKDAQAIISQLSDSEISKRYGNLKLDTLHKIGDGKVDPLVEMYQEHEIRIIPRKYQGRIGDFLNLGLSLHHFTAKSNQRSIEEHGLISMHRAKELGIKPDVVSSTSSRARDEYLSLDRYVHLSFTNRSAMAYSVENRTALELADYRVSPIVLNFPTTMFCRGYANARDAQWVSIQKITALDLIALFVGFDRMKYWQLMVANSISTELVRRDTANARARGFATWL